MTYILLKIKAERKKSTLNAACQRRCLPTEIDEDEGR